MQSLNKVAREGRETPALEKVKQPGPRLQPFVMAFMALDKTRPIHMGGPGFIQLSEMEAYCRLYGVHDREHFATVMREIDTRVLGARHEVIGKKRKADEQKRKAKSGVKRGRSGGGRRRKR